MSNNKKSNSNKNNSTSQKKDLGRSIFLEGELILDDLKREYEKNYHNEKTIKNKKRKLKKKRILLMFIILILIFGFMKFMKSTISNYKVYSSITNSKSEIVKLESKKNTIDLSKRVIEYINKNKKEVQIKNKDIILTIDAKKLKNKMNLNFVTYNKKINNENFNYSKALYIENNKILKKTKKISIKLPNYLHKNGIVDVYGIDNTYNIEPIKKGINVKNKSIDFNLSKKYKKYFITYVEVSKIELNNNFETTKNEILNFEIKYFPTTATIKEVEYYNIGDNFVIRNGNLISRKSGKFNITLKVKNSNIKKDIVVTVKKNVSKIENRNGLTYVNGILIVNKTYSLPKDYNPGSINQDALKKYEKMRDDAKKDNIKLWISSGFRSYETQEELYNYYVSKDGKKKADTYSARAGYSEHQTGYAMDLNIVDSSFENTKEAIWLEKNCYKYGFIIRYPKGKESITGYKYEPWHVRYLGEELAKKVYDSGLTLEEYLNIDSKYSE